MRYLDVVPVGILYLITVIAALVAVEIGYRVGDAWRRRSPHEKEGASGTMVAATLGLLAFLLAFITGVAVNRFDARQQLVVQEANAVGTAYLRAGYLEEPYRTEIRELLREYVDQRLAAIQPGRLEEARRRSEEIHAELWENVEAVVRESPTPPTSLFVSSINEVIDLHTGRVIASLDLRLPQEFLLILFFGALLTISMVGFHNGMLGGRSLIPLIALILVFSSVLLLIVDLDRSQQGVMRVSSQALVDLKEGL